ncbi:hypothetical protein AURDEDRAFT_117232 [Auricularia subglabra TFB-10046 SS5]|nr:hypothetical protein AURDEDRAFT_117232 [Auricularia subglabra TFB-10046 SS5]
MDAISEDAAAATAWRAIDAPTAASYADIETDSDSEVDYAYMASSPAAPSSPAAAPRFQYPGGLDNQQTSLTGTDVERDWGALAAQAARAEVDPNTPWPRGYFRPPPGYAAVPGSAPACMLPPTARGADDDELCNCAECAGCECAECAGCDCAECAECAGCDCAECAGCDCHECVDCDTDECVSCNGDDCVECDYNHRVFCTCYACLHGDEDNFVYTPYDFVHTPDGSLVDEDEELESLPEEVEDDDEPMPAMPTKDQDALDLQATLMEEKIAVIVQNVIEDGRGSKWNNGRRYERGDGNEADVEDDA